MEVIKIHSTRCHQKVGLTELDIWVSTFEICNPPYTNGLSEMETGLRGSGAWFETRIYSGVLLIIIKAKKPGFTK